MADQTATVEVTSNCPAERMPGSAWFATSWRRILVDMHIPDWDDEFLSKLDPERYVDTMAADGAVEMDVALDETLTVLSVDY